MKSRTLLAVLVCTLISMTAFSQSPPYSYGKRKIPLLPMIVTGVKANPPTGKTATPPTHADSVLAGYSDVAKAYFALGQRYEQNAKTLESEANSKFTTGIDGITGNGSISEDEARLQTLQSQNQTDVATAKSYSKQAESMYFLAKTNKFFTSIFTQGGFVKNSADAETYYNGFVSDSKAKFLSNTLLSFGTDGGTASIFNELYADYYGPFRFGFGALVSNKQTPSTGTADPNETKKDAVQRLLGGGGNGVFNLSYPILQMHSQNVFDLKLAASPRLGLDIPTLGTQNGQYALSYNLGLEGSAYYNGDLGVITPFVNFRFAEIGGNGLFYDNLTKTDHQSFAFHQVSFGFAFASMFRLSYGWNFGSAFVKTNFPNAISFSIVPQ